ncbi:G-protein coupled receptor dmsr-1-like [Dreissena polymorpha]|nr:G-protein coupled receptor dmsr-1-like [Dreissena polymorpha]
MAVWFTVSLAMFQYMIMCHNVTGHRMCCLHRAILTITIIAIATIIVCIPNYLASRVVKLTDFGFNSSGYYVYNSDLVLKHSFYIVFIFWFYGVFMKLVPCVMLSFLSAMVILAMYKASKQRLRLLEQTRSPDRDVNHLYNRTSWMLVFVVLFTVITEMPNGILAMLRGLNDIVYQEVYDNLGVVMDLIMLLNSVVNFVIYCSMSQQFRDTFKNIFAVKARCGKVYTVRKSDRTS